MWWTHCPAWCSIAGSTLLRASIRGDCPWQLTFPKPHLVKLRSSLCTHAFHRMDSKDHDIYVLDGWMLATKTPSMHHPRRWDVTTCMVWFLKYARFSLKMVNPRDIAVNAEEADVLISGQLYGWVARQTSTSQLSCVTKSLFWTKCAFFTNFVYKL